MSYSEPISWKDIAARSRTGRARLKWSHRVGFRGLVTGACARLWSLSLGVSVAACLVIGLAGCGASSGSESKRSGGGQTPTVQGTGAGDGATYTLPGEEVFPEGIAVFGGNYYVGSVGNGDVYRGDLTQPRASVFVPRGPGHRRSAGIKATADRLVVAHEEGHVGVYDRVTGEPVNRFSNALGEVSNVNDVTIAPNGDAYLTDYFLSRIYRIPAAAIAHHQSGTQPLPIFLDLSGTSFPAEEKSANGIAATADGRFLLVTHYSRGQLYLVRLSDKHVTRVDLHGQELKGPDGIVLTDAGVLYVVENDGVARIAKIDLSDRYDEGRILSRTTSPRFQTPTTAAIAGDRLVVVNSQFHEAGKPPFTVVNIPLP